MVCAGIRMSDIPQFPYAWLWGEQPLEAHLQRDALAEANRALDELRTGRFAGAALLQCAPGGSQTSATGADCGSFPVRRAAGQQPTVVTSRPSRGTPPKAQASQLY